MDASNVKQAKQVKSAEQVNTISQNDIQNDIVLDKFHEELKSSADDNNKVKINEFKSPSFYLPTLASVNDFLGFPSTQKQLIDLLETTYETPLDVKRSSRYGLFGKGVGLRTVSKIITWCKKLPLPFETMMTKRLMVKIERSRKAGSNAGHWLSAMQNFDVSFKFAGGSGEDEFTALLEFLEYRCNTEVDLLLELKQKVKAGKLKATDLAEAWKAQQPLWENNPRIPTRVTDDFVQIALLHSQQKSLTEQQTLTIIESYCYLCFDFYLEAITHYEVGCRLYYGKNKEKLENELGMITKAIYAYATDDAITTCFDGMLTELKNVASELVSETSYRKLASFIEIEEVQSGDYGESLADKQSNQLNRWRRGEDLPGAKKLTSFLQNLDDYADTSSGFVTFLMCRITMGMDKLVNEVLVQGRRENCNQADVKKVIKNVLAAMPEYYKVNLKKQLDKES
jgi:hypothetical protein